MPMRFIGGPSRSEIINLINIYADPPSGEQVVNGGFETGDVTGWTNEVLNYIVDNSTSHTGLFSLKMVGAGLTGSIRQYFLPRPIKQGYIFSFGLWYKMPLGFPAVGVGAQIIYADDSTTDVIFAGGTVNWLFVDLKSLLDPARGKVKGIRLKSPGVVDAWIDDVSLVGTG